MTVAIALIQFHSIEGPVVHFLVSDGVVDENLKEEISSMLNISVSGDFFIFRVSGITSYNLQFQVKSQRGRGHVELLMLSLITRDYPNKAHEEFFLKHSNDFIHFLKHARYADQLFHLDENLPEDIDMEAIERVFNATMEKLHDIIKAWTRQDWDGVPTQ